MNKVISSALSSLLITLIFQSCIKSPEYIKVAVTTDVHGMIFPIDMISHAETDHSLSHIYNYIQHQNEAPDTTFILLDNGDFLQGQPTVYYYNFIDTAGEHLSARVMNYMGYAAGTIGNHDIETGPDVYNKIRNEFEFPWMAANAVNRKTGIPYFEPYHIIKAGQIKIAVLGLVTPGIPNWLPENLWPDIEFRDMVETAKKWVPIIEKKVHPDILIGLFHAGTDFTYGGMDNQSLNNENASLLVAQEVPGFDLIFAGHDHNVTSQWITNSVGDSVLIIDPGSHARFIGEAIIHISQKKRTVVSIEGRNIPASNYKISDNFMDLFNEDFEKVKKYLSDTVVYLSEEMNSRDALWGPSSLTSLINEIQMEISGAEISFTAPLSIRAKLPKGYLLISDMFNLYRFENMLYKMRLTGEEIDRFLEYSASLWFNVMNAPSDHMLLFQSEESPRLKNPYYNFSSAAGIEYKVDLTKPNGNRVNITSLSDGRKFSPEAFYLVAINSYRGNGGGGHLTSGSGIPKEELKARLEWSSEKDLRYYLMKELMKQDTLYPIVSDNWSCFPVSYGTAGKLLDDAFLTN